MPAIDVAFMLSGPVFTVEVPDPVVPEPHYTASIELPTGARQFNYYPDRFSPTFPDSEFVVERVLKVPNDRVRVLRRIEDPLIWFIEWHLTRGSLVSHLREEDGLDASGLLFSSLSIADSGELVSLMPNPPLRRATSRTPGFEEIIGFFALDGSASLEMVRPGSLSERQVGELRDESGSGPQFVGTTRGIDVRSVNLGTADVNRFMESISEN